MHRERASLSQQRTITGAVRIFVSSFMSGATGLPCDVASGDIAMLGDQPARSEDFPASPSSAQVMGLADVRPADAVELIWGSLCGRAREEQSREPQSNKGAHRPRPDRSSLFPPARKRAALSSDAEQLAEGLTVRLAADDARTRCLTPRVCPATTGDAETLRDFPFLRVEISHDLRGCRGIQVESSVPTGVGAPALVQAPASRWRADRLQEFKRAIT